jgi:hypothetical protein
VRIAIFGSRASKTPVEAFANEDQFESVCSELGAVLGRAGHTLIVQSDRERTADAGVIDGVRQLDPGRRGRVEVWHRTRPKVDGGRIRTPFRNDPWIDKIPIPVAYVGPAHMRMLSRIDVAIVIGGGNNAYLAGQAARALDVRLIPVAAFGGAGRLLWQEIRDATGPASARAMDAHRFAQLGTVEKVVSAIHEEVRSLPRLMIVHGRSNDKDAVAALLRTNGATPIIMKDSFVAGETIPAEFERLALQVDGAVVVVTPDDEGRPTTAPDGNPLRGAALGLRARQNVVLEYGWFWCRFGRRNVALLVRGEVELPSDIAGVLHCAYRSTSELEDALREFVDRFHK